MKWQSVLFLMMLAGVSTAQAQNKSLAATMEVYVFPKAGQDAAQQSKDEAACYEWATSSVGHDPFALTKQAAQQQVETEQAKEKAKRTGEGAGVGGAVRGAAVGAIIGEIADDDAGKGAAVGAGLGAIAARRRARVDKQMAVKEAEEYGKAKQQATQQQMENFKKAFSVCLEAKDYLVKY